MNRYEQILIDARQLAHILGPAEAARRLGISREAVQRALEAATPRETPPAPIPRSPDQNAC